MLRFFRRHRLSVELAAFLVAGLVGSYLGLSNISSHCSIAKTVEPQRHGDNPHATENKNDAAHTGSYKSNNFLSLFFSVYTSQPQTNTNESHSQWENESWWGKFWCEVKATDAAIAFFTYGLFVIGWFAIRNGNRLAHELERAYISGGGPWINNAPPLFPLVTGFQLRIDNYGKSPATVTAWAVEICDINSIPKRPAYLGRGYTRKIRFRATIRPGQEGLEIVNIPFNQTIITPIAYGRIWYRDIWRRKHFFSFILPFNATANHAAASKAHWTFTDWT